MLIPSIDLMGGKIVQLVQGQTKALEFENFAEWVARFSRYPLVQLVDLDAAMGMGSNRTLVAEFCGKLPCQVGGGIRSTDDAQAVLDCGAKKIIIGSSLINMLSQTQETPAGTPRATVDTTFAGSLSGRFGAERLVFAVDARSGRVAIHGWKTITEIEPAAMMQQLEPFCSAFLYTHIDTEGLLKGIPMDVVRNLRQKTARQLIAAGGIHRSEEIEELNNIGIDAVVGMAIYSGLLAV
jgi:phosphoribosylformimino-5-aminoimidazole carboxamide ribotide isomerase